LLILSNLLEIFIAGAFLAATPERGQDQDSTVPVRSLVDAERNFARTALERGIRNSFLEFRAEDSIVFAPGPTNGKKLYIDYKDDGQKLIWEPIFATVARAGDLGYTTGPWELKKSAKDEKPIEFGQFISIWKKQADGSWKVIVDVGIDNPNSGEATGEIQISTPTSRKINPESARKALQRAKRNFADAAKSDMGSAIIAADSDQIRVYRDNSFPAVGIAAARMLLGANHNKLAIEPSGDRMSDSYDLAFEYGQYLNEHDITNEHAYYLSIWKIDGNGDWKLVLDLQKKRPAENKPN
jgi:ketosteroid isomerase-like protein